MILCECGEFIEDDFFKDYIKTSSNPSTPTIGHQKCGLIFDFVDERISKKYSSRKELKTIAMKFAEKRKLENETIPRFIHGMDEHMIPQFYQDTGEMRKEFFGTWIGVVRPRLAWNTPPEPTRAWA